MTDAAGCIYAGEVMHRRRFPVAYRFRYRVFNLFVDIDRIDEAVAHCRLFSHNRFNLFDFHDRDHGLRDGSSLRAWAERLLRDAGLPDAGTRIHLLCFPRVLGYVFNPLSLWYVETAEGRPVAVLCEVHNTFDESHTYVLHAQGAALSWPVTGEHDKQFHVSPFIDMNARYHFRLSRPDARLQYVIREYQQDRLLLAAVQTGQRRPLNDRTWLALALRIPLMTFKVMAMIHWQALKLWFRQVPFHRKPSPPRKEFSS
ncbi:MAG: hypothetical protein CMN57_12440 [Gammaproteobacteria bacterium]|nr:hypothetical protein [Gammaproteobacteria bacterium]